MKYYYDQKFHSFLNEKITVTKNDLFWGLGPWYQSTEVATF